MIILLILILAFIGIIVYNSSKNHYSKSNHVDTITLNPKPTVKKSTSDSITVSVSSSIKQTEPDYPPFILPNMSNRVIMHKYKVKGLNPRTKRMKTCIVIAKEGAPEHEFALKSELKEPFTITLEDTLPSEAQLKFAKNINIPIPSGATNTDISCLLSRQLDQFYDDYISNGLLEYAAEHSIYLSSYDSSLGGARRIFNVFQEHNSLDLFIFFSYLIHCLNYNIQIENLNDSEYKDIFYSLGTLCNQNTEFIKTINSFSDDNFNHLLKKKHIDGRNKRNLQLSNFINNYLKQNISR